MTPDHTDLWFLPLGGCGEIGMNLNLYGHDGQWLMVDCGVTFADPGQTHQPHVQMPDPSFIEQHRDKLAGIVITHAHEDHIGAVPYLWRRFRAPVYATAFTVEILKRKLAEFGLIGTVPVTVVQAGDRIPIGPFEVEWLHITHSIPEPNAIMVRTSVGSVFHTADWKLDPDPVLGDRYQAELFQRLAEDPPNAMVCDSTNALVEGHSVSEAVLYEGLRKVVTEAEGRVVVSCFASNVARLKTLMRVAEDSDRRVAILGRSLKNMVSAAKATGYWKHQAPFIDPFDLGYFPKAHFLAIATGSQGEPRAALHRLARDQHPDLTLDAGDTVVFSARVIPGNERLVENLINLFKRRGIHVVTAEEYGLPIHASGHPAQDELKQMYQWVQPQLAIPVHGEVEHMAANARVAKECGVPRQLTGENGDLFFIGPVPGVRRQAVKTGRLGWDRDALIPVPE
ncbi:ribonuclease J [Saccharospirillum salsuginis]|uniref:MBL fold hydrolase n=1 Tax=Saccharospirillum salsuginis TaxID=418750 RepID=A0A918K1Q5_9GAMM|nr:ribonuclease J [Saccharospirillum salsuginis]GGX39860.1 MBL fold hydrolase [Saccharospirillum salsuginis]